MRMNERKLTELPFFLDSFMEPDGTRRLLRAADILSDYTVLRQKQPTLIHGHTGNPIHSLHQVNRYSNSQAEVPHHDTAD